MAIASARLSGAESADAQRHLKEVESAVERLRDPVARLRYGLAWPALGPAGAERLRGDARIAAVVDDPSIDCSQSVEGLVEQESRHVQMHARAVFMLLRASGIVQARVRWKERRGTPPEWGYEIGCRLLHEGLANWARTLDQREFWIELRLRAKELNDPRIDENLLARMEAEAPLLPLSSFADVARDLLRVGDGPACKAVVEAMRRGSGNKLQLEAALAEVYGPTCARATATIDGLAANLKGMKSTQGANYLALLRRFETEVAPDLEMVLQVGDLPGYSEELLRDKATEFLRSLAVAAANTANAFDVSEAALAIAARAANSAALRAKVEEDQRTVSRLVAQSRVAAKSKPASDRLQKALSARNLRGAIQALDELLSVCDPEDAAELRELRQKVSTSYASELYNRGIQCAEVGDRANALTHLQEARRYETVPSEQAIIDRALAAVRSGSGAGQSRGCLVPIAIVIGVFGVGVAATSGVLSVLLAATASFTMSMLEAMP